MGASDGTGDSVPVAEVAITTSELKGYYETMDGQQVTADDAVRILDVILNRDASEDLTITDINNALTSLRDSVVLLNDEIECLYRLNGLLIFELLEKGINIESKELINELKTYYGN